MNVNIVFIKNAQWWNVASRVIRLWTKSKYDHVGIYISKGQLTPLKKQDSYRCIPELHHEYVQAPLIFDATLTKGVKLRKFNDATKHEIISLQNTGLKMLDLVNFIIEHNHKRYDIKGVLAFALPVIKQRKKFFYCSELVASFFSKQQLIAVGNKPSPKQIYDVLKRYKNG
tara:strand:+ start:8882 stop:9394 length:513 start_codon:yes stop_codon:yes gene_type:complete